MTIQDAKEELVLLLTAIRDRTPREWATYDPLGDAIVLAQAIADEGKDRVVLEIKASPVLRDQPETIAEAVPTLW